MGRRLKRKATDSPGSNNSQQKMMFNPDFFVGDDLDVNIFQDDLITEPLTNSPEETKVPMSEIQHLFLLY
jgi:hypothetical protein